MHRNSAAQSLLAHHKQQMWRLRSLAAAAAAAVCKRPSGQAKYCLSVPPHHPHPHPHLHPPPILFAFGTFVLSMVTHRWTPITVDGVGWGVGGIYGGAIGVISSSGKQWAGRVAFDSVRPTAGVNSTHAPQWCLSLSAQVTSNKHCKQRGGGRDGGGAKRRHGNQRAGVCTRGGT